MAGHWALKSAAELGREINAGRISPVDLAEAHLDAIASHPQAERIFARTTPARARAEAMAAHGRARRGFRKGLLDGVPISWKDLFDTAGVATESGSALLRNRVCRFRAAAACRSGWTCGASPATASSPRCWKPPAHVMPTC